jgi:hypothetical protein
MTYACNAVEMAEMTVSGSDMTIIVLELANTGSSSRWTDRFPSLSAEQIEKLQGATFLVYPNIIDACDAFERLTADCAAAGPVDLVTGTITLVHAPFGEDDGVDRMFWDLDDTTRPVRNGKSWKHEMIADRI